MNRQADIGIRVCFWQESALKPHQGTEKQTLALDYTLSEKQNPHKGTDKQTLALEYAFGRKAN